MLVSVRLLIAEVRFSTVFLTLLKELQEDGRVKADVIHGQFRPLQLDIGNTGFYGSEEWCSSLFARHKEIYTGFNTRLRNRRMLYRMGDVTSRCSPYEVNL